jgi:hypothetical protein
VEWLSGKPIEVGPSSAQGAGIMVGWGMLVPGPEGQGSQQGGDPVGPEGWGSWQGMALVIPCRAGAHQGLKGGGTEEWGSQWSVDPAQAVACGPRGHFGPESWIRSCHVELGPSSA